MADSLVEFISNIIKDIMSRENIDKFMPLLGTLIIFITISNVLGVFPLLSAPTSDINTTVALSLVIFFAIHFYGVAANGFFKYFKDMASPIFMLPLEIIGQISRTLSLSLRLFGNILSGELIASIVFSLVPLFFTAAFDRAKFTNRSFAGICFYSACVSIYFIGGRNIANIINFNKQERIPIYE